MYGSFLSGSGVALARETIAASITDISTFQVRRVSYLSLVVDGP